MIVSGGFRTYIILSIGSMGCWQSHRCLGNVELQLLLLWIACTFSLRRVQNYFWLVLLTFFFIQPGILFLYLNCFHIELFVWKSASVFLICLHNFITYLALSQRKWNLNISQLHFSCVGFFLQINKFMVSQVWIYEVEFLGLLKFLYLFFYLRVNVVVCLVKIIYGNTLMF